MTCFMRRFRWKGGLTVDPGKLVLDLEELRKMMRLQRAPDLQHLDSANAMLRRGDPPHATRWSVMRTGRRLRRAIIYRAYASTICR